MKIAQKVWYPNNVILDSGISFPETTSSSTKSITIKKFGVQALPGTRIILGDKEENYITIGYSGVFEFSFEDAPLWIAKITIPKSSLIINQSANAAVILDIFYEETEGSEL